MRRPLCRRCRRHPVFKLRDHGESRRAFRRRLEQGGLRFWCIAESCAHLLAPERPRRVA